MSCSIGQSWYHVRIPSRMAIHAKTRSKIQGFIFFIFYFIIFFIFLFFFWCFYTTCKNAWKKSKTRFAQLALRGAFLIFFIITNKKYCTVLYSTVLYSTVQYCTVRVVGPIVPPGSPDALGKAKTKVFLRFFKVRSQKQWFSFGFSKVRAKNMSPIPAKSPQNQCKNNGFWASRNSEADLLKSPGNATFGAEPTLGSPCRGSGWR